MAVDETNKVDGLAVDEERNALVLLLSDHLNWEDEYHHLKILQDKINAYIAFVEERQFEVIYPEHDFEMAVIEVHFQYEITENCGKFLQAVQDQIGQMGIKIEALIG